MSVTAATVIIFDPHGVVDASTTDEVVVHGPFTLEMQTDEAGTPAPFVVLTTMENIDTGHAWYIAAWHVRQGDAEKDLEHEQEQVRLCVNENSEEYSDMHVNAGLICV